MIIHTPDGKVLPYPFSSNAVTGYRAEVIIIYADDIKRMIAMLDQEPARLRNALVQLEARFKP